MVCFCGIDSDSKFHFDELELRRGFTDTDYNMYFKTRSSTNPIFFLSAWDFSMEIHLIFQ